VILARMWVTYLQAIELARHQGARSLELRAAMNLARLKHRLGKVEEAETLLMSVHEQFTEGFETVDLKAAKALFECFRRTPGRKPAA
jgi:predicted ATPase